MTDDDNKALAISFSGPCRSRGAARAMGGIRLVTRASAPSRRIPPGDGPHSVGIHDGPEARGGRAGPQLDLHCGVPASRRLVPRGRADSERQTAPPPHRQQLRPRRQAQRRCRLCGGRVLRRHRPHRDGRHLRAHHLLGQRHCHFRPLLCPRPGTGPRPRACRPSAHP